MKFSARIFIGFLLLTSLINISMSDDDDDHADDHADDGDHVHDDGDGDDHADDDDHDHDDDDGHDHESVSSIDSCFINSFVLCI